MSSRSTEDIESQEVLQELLQGHTNKAVEQAKIFNEQIKKILETNKLKNRFIKIVSHYCDIEEQKLQKAKVVTKKVKFANTHKIVPRSILKYYKKGYHHHTEDYGSKKATIEETDNSNPIILLSKGKIEILNLQSTRYKYYLNQNSSQNFKTLITFLVENNYVL